METLVPGPRTFTIERVRNILDQATYKPQPGESLFPVPFFCDGLDGIRLPNGGSRIWGSKTEQENYWITQLNQHVLAIQEAPSRYCESLDNAASRTVECHLQTSDPDTVVQRACQWLRRLPALPIEPSFTLSGRVTQALPDEYFWKDLDSEGRPSKTWATLKAVAFVGTNVIRMALLIAIATDPDRPQYSHEGHLKDFINCLAIQCKKQRSDCAENFVSKVYLWSSWHRARMLFFSLLLSWQLQIGHDSMRNNLLDLLEPLCPYSIGFDVKSSRPDNTTAWSNPDPPGYMCRWAFESIRTDRAAIGADFRILHHRFQEIFGTRPPRCRRETSSSGQQCNGTSSYACHRFLNSEVTDQKHDLSCLRDSSCEPLFWNRESYVAVKNAPRAVRLRLSEQGQIAYCAASDKTMSISHVWSHGQGGRPDEAPGFNRCLHQRYAHIAEKHGCDSYWMDTPCIPSEDSLRNEAITRINEVFLSSKFTLVCDRDIMDIDVCDLTVERQESLLATLLVCDWNVRAWTFLEALRGRKSIFLLCKDHRIISFTDILRTVNSIGRIDLSILYLTSPQFLPAPVLLGKSPRRTLKMEGFVTVEEAACLLSRRHASREGDEVIIWSLLHGHKVYKSPRDLWNHANNAPCPLRVPGVKGILSTGFLMSDLPRIEGHTGFSWAPRRPNMLPPADGKMYPSIQYYPYDGINTEGARVTEQGLEAEWWMATIKYPSINILTGWIHSFFHPQPKREVFAKYLKPYTYGAALLPVCRSSNRFTKNQGYRGTLQNPKANLVAIVGSQDEEFWTWLGVYEWDTSIAKNRLPPMYGTKIIII